MDFLKSGKETIRIECEALASLQESLDQRFVKSVERLLNCKGRVVITGIGKSALVGQKMVATLNSTGTHAMFMHAADAVHGDLGMIGEEDVVICISKSGETSELKILIPILKKQGTEVISMTAQPQSFLAIQADDLLYTPVSQEADPHNLAPTSSSTVQLAMGDAIAMSLLKARGFKEQDFAKFHPGGSLGKKLYIQVKDMKPEEHNPCVQVDTTMREILLEMSGSRMGATAVLEDELLKGVITDGDIRRWFEKGGSGQAMAADLMNPHPKVVQFNDMAVSAYDHMREWSINQLLVLDDTRYVGMIHLHDLLREGIV